MTLKPIFFQSNLMPMVPYISPSNYYIINVKKSYIKVAKRSRNRGFCEERWPFQDGEDDQTCACI